jgi:hypothetical protein
MRDIALFLKSYCPDLALVERLLDSVATHNRDRIPVFISVPANDVPAFQGLTRRFADVSVLADDHFATPRVEEKIWSFPPGYITQQMVKLSVHRLSEARNYVMLDSDTYFIRDFGTADFITPDGTGLSVFSSDKDLVADPAYAPFNELRAKRINLVADRMNIPLYARATCHNNTVFQQSVLSDFHEWCRAEDLTLLDLMTIAPIEFSWYNFFLLRHCSNRLVRVEPFIKMVHTRSEYRRLIRAGFSHKSLRRSYLGVCLNSGWAGTEQGRYVSRIESGSRTAALVAGTDRARYIAARELQLFVEARRERPLPRFRHRGQPS